MSSVKAGVVGASGYTGSQLVELLVDHPTFECTLATSRQHQGQSLSELYPYLSGSVDHTLEAPDFSTIQQCDLLFLAVPHGHSMDYVPKVERSDTKIVDLAGDYRLSTADLFEQTYDQDHTDPDTVPEAVYGLSEFNEDAIKTADLVANPGCYVTSVLLPLIPLLEKSLVQSPLFVDSKSGISGAGRSPSETTMFMNVNDEVKPYKIGSHRHQTEMIDHLPGDPPLTFVPHVVAAERGIESAIYTQLSDGSSIDDVRETLRNLAEQFEIIRYREEPAGIRAVAHTPYCDLSVHADGDRVVIVSCLDNLMKGAASQALQNGNLVMGEPMNRGLLDD